MAAKYYLLLSDISAKLYLIQELYNRAKSYHLLHGDIKKLKKKFLIFNFWIIIFSWREQDLKMS